MIGLGILAYLGVLVFGAIGWCLLVSLIVGICMVIDDRDPSGCGFVFLHLIGVTLCVGLVLLCAGV